MTPPDWPQLQRALAARPRRALRRPRHAAVLIPFLDDGLAPRLILTRRTEALPTHKGQVAFPGGTLQPGDPDQVAAALREAHEEIGLDPALVEVIGLLDDFPTLHDDMAVTPVLGRLTQTPTLRPDPGEVARIFEIPLAVLQEGQRWTTQHMERKGRLWPVFFCDYDGESLWGLSAYITLHLLEHLPGGAPLQLPMR